MGYFRELPDLEYLSPLSERTSSSDYVLAKNLFRRVKLRTDLQNIFTVFDKYQIQENKRPDQVAEELYGSANLDWVVLISAGITHIRDQWPLSNKDIYDFAYNVYGDNLTSTHHYETKEVKDSNGRLILPAGQVVDYNFKSPRPETDEEPTRSYVRYYDSVSGVYVRKDDITIPVTNLEYEIKKNDEKRGVYVLKRGYLQQFLNDTRNIMIYPKSSQYVNTRLIRSDNIRIKSP
jgi:hypothetical protein